MIPNIDWQKIYYKKIIELEVLKLKDKLFVVIRSFPDPDPSKGYTLFEAKIPLNALNTLNTKSVFKWG